MVDATPQVVATPVGMTVRARATVLESDGRRVLFAVETWDEREKIAEGRRGRFVGPDMARFLQRAMHSSDTILDESRRAACRRPAVAAPRRR